MYESPIWMAFQSVIEKAAKELDETVFRAVLHADVKVDRDELLRALQYDRDQFDKGYHEGYIKGQASQPSATWGEWQQLPDDYDWNVWRCSACNEEFVLEAGTPKENGYKFCPHCGATMFMEDEQYDFGFEEDDDA